jgi:hypothetical protein
VFVIGSFVCSIHPRAKNLFAEPAPTLRHPIFGRHKFFAKAINLISGLRKVSETCVRAFLLTTPCCTSTCRLLTILCLAYLSLTIPTGTCTVQKEQNNDCRSTNARQNFSTRRSSVPCTLNFTSYSDVLASTFFTWTVRPIALSSRRSFQNRFPSRVCGHHESGVDTM